jgi:hypothetical protein
MFILSHVMTKLISVCSKFFYFDCKDELSMTLSYSYDFTKIERHICVPLKHTRINIGFANHPPW